jgi:hypothetical protein
MAERDDVFTIPSKYKLNNPSDRVVHPSSSILIVRIGIAFLVQVKRDKPSGTIHGSNTSLKAGSQLHLHANNELEVTKSRG